MCPDATPEPPPARRDARAAEAPPALAPRLRVLVYRSRAVDRWDAARLKALEDQASRFNTQAGITGILLFDGQYFVQLLEGPAEAVAQLFGRIADDPRHAEVLVLVDEVTRRRGLARWAMQALWMPPAAAPGGAPPWEPALPGVDREDRAWRIVRTFAERRGLGPQPPGPGPAPPPPEARQWQLEPPCPLPLARAPSAAPPGQPRFAFQPIVDPLAGQVCAVEALLRGNAGEPASALLQPLSPGARHGFDMACKRQAFAQAAALGLGAPLAVNLLPMALVRVPRAVSRLAAMAAAHGFAPDEVIVEVTEDEAIGHRAAFIAAAAELRAAGFRLALDDFGAGHAGLGLLADVPPDRLKIDRHLVQGIAGHATRQAIVGAVVTLCGQLGIALVAEGVETVEDWWALHACGVRQFQGYLFASPVCGVPCVRWPSTTRH